MIFFAILQYLLYLPFLYAFVFLIGKYLDYI